jgi:hypothetical protein
MEPFSHEFVASPIVLRCGAENGWRRLVEALDEEGSRGRWNLQNPAPGRNWVDGAAHMSVVAAPKAQGLVIQDLLRCDVVSHSFPFFTGLCEKSPAGAASLALLTGRHK